MCGKSLKSRNEGCGERERERGGVTKKELSDHLTPYLSVLEAISRNTSSVKRGPTAVDPRVVTSELSSSHVIGHAFRPLFLELHCYTL